MRSPLRNSPTSCFPVKSNPIPCKSFLTFPNSPSSAPPASSAIWSPNPFRNPAIWSVMAPMSGSKMAPSTSPTIDRSMLPILKFLTIDISLFGRLMRSASEWMSVRDVTMFSMKDIT